MKSYLYILIVFLSCLLLKNVYASESYFDTLFMPKNALKYENAAIVCSKLYTKYYNNEEKDSLNMLVDYWLDLRYNNTSFIRKEDIFYSGNWFIKKDEARFRVKLLRDLDLETISTTQIDSKKEEYLNAIMQFKIRAGQKDFVRLDPKNPSFNESYRNNCSYIEPDSEFDRATEAYAHSLLEKYDSTDVRRLICEMYSDLHQPLFEVISKEQYKNTSLVKEYFASTSNQKGGIILSLSQGIWMPQGNLSMLGLHPETGFGIGGFKNDLSWLLSYKFRYLNSDTPYPVYTEEGIKESSMFFSSLLSLDFRYSWASIDNLKFNSLCSIGLEVLNFAEDVMSDSERQDHKSNDHFFSYTLGIGLQYYYSNRHSIGIDFIYHPVDRSGNDYLRATGHTISINMSYSFQLINFPDVFGDNLFD